MVAVVRHNLAITTVVRVVKSVATRHQVNVVRASSVVEMLLMVLVVWAVLFVLTVLRQLLQIVAVEM